MIKLQENKNVKILSHYKGGGLCVITAYDICLMLGVAVFKDWIRDGLEKKIMEFSIKLSGPTQPAPLMKKKKNIALKGFKSSES